MRWVRLRLRTLKIAVAVAAVIFGVEALRRRDRAFRERAAYHRAWVRNRGRFFSPIILLPPYDRAYSQDSLKDWHRRMAEKYERAARRPWLPVEPDPPEPD